jgi:hypothetical protein
MSPVSLLSRRQLIDLESLQQYREHVSKVVANRPNAAEAATPLTTTQTINKH